MPPRRSNVIVSTDVVGAASAATGVTPQRTLLRLKKNAVDATQQQQLPPPQPLIQSDVEETTIMFGTVASSNVPPTSTSARPTTILEANRLANASKNFAPQPVTFGASLDSATQAADLQRAIAIQQQQFEHLRLQTLLQQQQQQQQQQQFAHQHGPMANFLPSSSALPVASAVSSINNSTMPTSLVSAVNATVPQNVVKKPKTTRKEKPAVTPAFVSPGVSSTSISTDPRAQPLQTLLVNSNMSDATMNLAQSAVYAPQMPTLSFGYSVPQSLPAQQSMISHADIASIAVALQRQMQTQRQFTDELVKELKKMALLRSLNSGIDLPDVAFQMTQRLEKIFNRPLIESESTILVSMLQFSVQEKIFASRSFGAPIKEALTAASQQLSADDNCTSADARQRVLMHVPLRPISVLTPKTLERRKNTHLLNSGSVQQTVPRTDAVLPAKRKTPSQEVASNCITDIQEKLNLPESIKQDSYLFSRVAQTSRKSADIALLTASSRSASSVVSSHTASTSTAHPQHAQQDSIVNASANDDNDDIDEDLEEDVEE